MYYIYHIPERNKIGVSVNVERRMNEHKWTGFYEILEEHTDPQVAGDRELELQEQYGYPRDTNHYTAILARGVKGLANVKYENRIVFNREHQQMASEAAHKAKLERGIYFKINKPKRKLTYQDAQEIRQLAKNGEPQRAIAKMYGVAHRTVGNIIHYRTYRNE